MSLQRHDIAPSRNHAARLHRRSARNPALPTMQPLEDRRLLSDVPGFPDDTLTRQFTDTVAGFRIEYQEHEHSGHATGSLWIYGPDTDDRITLSRNKSLAKAIDFDFNGTVHTIDFADLADWTSWGISTGGGRNRLEVTFAAEDAKLMPFSGFQVYGGRGNDELIAGEAPVLFRGEAGDDVLRGGPGDDWLEGGQGVDSLYGGAGNDALRTGTGHDPRNPSDGTVEEGEIYDGGPGDDTFQDPPNAVVPLPDGGVAPAPPAPEQPPAGSEPLPASPGAPAGAPTNGLLLDEQFADGGRRTLDIAHLDRSMTVEPLAGGQFLVGGFSRVPTGDVNDEGDTGVLLKLNADGSLDKTFGNEGVVRSRLFEQGISDIAIQPDGKILAAGTAWTGHSRGADLAVARFNPDGSLDANFGEGGRATVDFGSTRDEGAVVAVAPDGKVVLAGSAGLSYLGGMPRDPQGNLLDESDVAVARLNADGTPDTGFGEGGTVTFDFRNGRRTSREGAADVAVAPDGSVVLTANAIGWDATGAARNTAYLIRLGRDGAPDATFSGDGMVALYDARRHASFGDFVLGDDGAVVTVLNVGTPAVPTGPDAQTTPMLIRFGADGAPDHEFGEGGVAAVAAAGADVAATDLRRLDDGTLAVAGRSGHQLFLATFDAADGRRLSLASGASDYDRFTDVPLVGHAGELIVAGAKRLPSDDPYAFDSDLSVARMKVTDDVPPPAEDPAPGNPAPAPAPWPVPTPPLIPPPAHEPPAKPREVRLVGAPSLRARFSGKRAVRSGAAYTFKVVYRADPGTRLDLSSLGDGDATVTGPGFAAPATLLKAKANRKGTKVTATYRVDAPGGAFDRADNGTYTVLLRPGAVAPAVAAPSARSLFPVPAVTDSVLFADPTSGQALGSFVVRAK